MPEAKQSQSPQTVGDSASDAAMDPAGVTPKADKPGTAATIDGDPLFVRASELHPAPRDWERYETLGLLGTGGMGAVYKARDRRLGRIVALKFIRGDDPVLKQRLLQEARAQSRIEHDHVCKVHEVGEINGHAYIAMQYVEGETLALAQKGMQLEDKVLVMLTVSEAVHAAHRLGIIHRDLKPGNVMVDRGEDRRFRPFVMDFGLAHDPSSAQRLTQSGALLGTPEYMSPEQARSDVKLIDRRSDVYSLGAMLYDLLTGQPPFTGNSIADVLLQVIDREPIAPRRHRSDLPLDLETITLKCLQKEPTARYESAKALADDLRRYLDGEPVLARRLGLTQRLYRQIRRHKALVALGAALLVSVLGLIVNGVRAQVVASRQAERAQRLGQEISKMEWLLRSARQLPLHNLDREKIIVRRRMAQLQTELAGYGASSRGLGHYALGRGHLALHEYPQALTQLQLAIQQGNQSADVHYALGFVLGKHFEQAMFEARLSGGGDWAKKQLKELEPKYLAPAIDSLKRSRAMQSDAPEYLEALIAYYQRDYELALKKAEVAELEAPWLYEAAKLRGDIHLERALQAGDSGKNDESAKEFAAAVSSYNEAAEGGRSDAEVYEGLAEAWVRQIEAALVRGQPTDAAYAAAVAASDKVSTAEPQSVAGRLKKAYAALMTMSTGAANSAERVQQCLTEAQAVLDKEPENPYASDVAASCNDFAADSAQSRGEDPEPLLRKALSLQEPALRSHPHFLWGLNDLANTYLMFGTNLQLRGDSAAKEYVEKSLDNFTRAVALDPTYLLALINGQFARSKLVSLATSDQEIRSLLTQAHEAWAQCKKENSQFQLCDINYLVVHARAVERISLSGADPQPQLKQAQETLATVRKLGGSFPEAERYAALTQLVAATDQVRKNQNPEDMLAELQATLTRCFAIVATDAMCRTLAAQADLVAADWQAQRSKPTLPSLTLALQRATEATKSPESYPDAWWVLAETYLRMAQAPSVKPKARDEYLSAGLAAIQKVFAVNPKHALGRATLGALELLRAQNLQDPRERRAAAQAAVAALGQAQSVDPLLAHDCASRLAQAKTLVAAP